MSTRWLPRISGLGTGGGSPPGGVDHFCPNVIVGNVPAGDPPAAQAAPFQYVGDPGDGSGIATALAAVVGGGAVCVRPGTYIVTGAPLTVPVGVKMFGGGINTVLTAGGTSRQLVRQLANSVVEGFQLRVAEPPLGAKGTEIVLLDSDGVLRDCFIFGGAAAGEPVFAETLTAMVRVASAQTPQSGCSFEELIITNVPTNLIGMDLVGSFHAARRIQFRREFASRGAGPGIRIDGDRNEATAISGVVIKGFEVTGDSNCIEGSLETTGVADGVDLVAALRSRVSVLVTNGAPALTSIGVRIRGTSDRNTIIGASVQGYDTGVDIAAGADRNILLGTQIDAVTSDVVDLGTLTETAHVRV